MKPILLILLFLCSHIAFSQGVVVSSDRMNVLYAGIENPVSIAAENYSFKDLVVEISGGSIYQHEYMHGRYVVKVSTPGRAIIVVKNKKGKILGEVTFRAKPLPDPIAMVGGMNGGIIGKSKFKVQMGIIAMLENFDFDLMYNILEFKLVTTNNNQLYVSETNGPLFSNEMRKIIQNVASGDVILFTDIIVKGPDNIERRLKPVVYYIDYQKTFSCDTNYLYSPHEQLLSTRTEEKTQYVYLNTCKTTDIAEGKLENGLKLGWWEYRKIIGNDTLMMRKEKVMGDTTLQVLYENGQLYKKQNIVGGLLFGAYEEYFSSEKIKTKGQYAMDSVIIDTMYVIDPIDFDEKIEYIRNYKIYKSGTWQYFNEVGILIKEEKYFKGKLVE